MGLTYYRRENKQQYIECQAVTRAKEVKQSTDLDQLDFTWALKIAQGNFPPGDDDSETVFSISWLYIPRVSESPKDDQQLNNEGEGIPICFSITSNPERHHDNKNHDNKMLYGSTMTQSNLRNIASTIAYAKKGSRIFSRQHFLSATVSLIYPSSACSTCWARLKPRHSHAKREKCLPP